MATFASGTRQIGGGNDGDDDDGDVSGLAGRYADSWAVVVGINDYPDNPLSCAVHDASAIARVLIDRYCFDPKKVYLVLDDPPESEPHPLHAWVLQNADRFGCMETSATASLIRGLVTTTLPELAGPDDRVLFYFAGHGTSRRAPGQPADRSRPYLLAADSVHNQWHTYISVEELLQAEQDYKAKHVLYVLDACCAGLAGMKLRDGEGAAKFESALYRRPARQCFAAGTADELAADGGRDGHSIFTWHLLDALENSADDVLVASTIMDKVMVNVGRDPRHRQVPSGFPIAGHRGGQFVFDRRVELTVDERARLARLLIDEVDRRLDEPSVVELGLRLWDAIEAESAPGPLREEARRSRAQALLMLGRDEEARSLLADPRLVDDSGATLLRAIAWLRGSRDPSGSVCAERTELARQELVTLAMRHPEHPYASWATQTARTLDSQRTRFGSRYALLVGVGTYKHHPDWILRGCAGDVERMRSALRERLGFDEVTTIVGEQATRQRVLAVFAEVAARAQPEDVFLFYFSGNGALRPMADSANSVAVFFCYDVDLNDPASQLTEVDIEQALERIGAGDKLVITDACNLAPPVGAVLPGYRFLSGGRRAQPTFEVEQDGSYGGAFTHSLVRAIRSIAEPLGRGNARPSSVANTPVSTLLETIHQDLGQRGLSRQIPQYIGPPGPLIAAGSNLSYEIVDLVERRAPRRFGAAALDAFVATFESALPTPLGLALGDALVRRGHHARAIELLTGLVRDVHATFALVRAQLERGNYIDALTTWRGSAAARDHAGARAPKLERLMESLATRRGRALLVGTTGHMRRRQWASPLYQMRDALVRRAGFSVDDVDVIVDGGTREVIDALRRAAADNDSGRTFFFFVGPGTAEDPIQLASRDGVAAHQADLSLAALDKVVPSGGSVTACMLVTETLPPAPAAAIIAGGASWTELRARAGTVTRDVGLEPLGLLLAFLESEACPTATMGDLLHRARTGISDVHTSGDLDTPLFAPHALLAAENLVDELRLTPPVAVAPLLMRLTEQRDLAAHAWLHLGVVRAASGSPEAGLLDIERALEVKRADASGNAGDDDAPAPVRFPEAHYHRGRLLIEARRYGEAEVALGIAIDQDPGNARAYYHRARAIYSLIDRNLERNAREALDQYAALDAPLGFDDPPRPRRAST